MWRGEKEDVRKQEIRKETEESSDTQEERAMLDRNRPGRGGGKGTGSARRNGQAGIAV